MPISPEWSDFLENHPDAHLLQTAAWGSLKHAFGWQAETILEGQTGALVLFRKLPLGFTIAYVPMGPIPSNPESLKKLLPSIDALCKEKKAIFLKLEPDSFESPEWAAALGSAGFTPSVQHIQPPRTILLDITGTEAEALARLKSKTRYAIRSSEKRGVAVEPSEDISVFYEMMEHTSRRDAFAIHSEKYFRTLFSLFHPHVDMEMLIATFEGKPIAGVIVFARGNRAWYLYGASVDEHRDLMAPRLLQWESIRWAKRRGCTEYDMWGIPDFDEATLEAEFQNRSEGLWSLYRYKRGFLGKVVRFAGAYDRPYHPILFPLYRFWAGYRSRRGL